MYHIYSIFKLTSSGRDKEYYNIWVVTYVHLFLSWHILKKNASCMFSSPFDEFCQASNLAIR